MAGHSFSTSALDPLFDFESHWNKPEREFINPELEAMRKALWTKVREYCGIIGLETFPTKNPGRNTVPPEWEFENPARFRRVVDSLHSLAGEIVAIHGHFVRKGRAYVLGGP